jgi:hypothetical protein
MELNTSVVLDDMPHQSRTNSCETNIRKYNCKDIPGNFMDNEFANNMLQDIRNDNDK